MSNLNWSGCPEVEAVPGKLSGAWVLRNTRMAVSAILENAQAGATIDNLLELYDGLNRKQIQAVLDFAAQAQSAADLLQL